MSRRFEIEGVEYPKPVKQERKSFFAVRLIQARNFVWLIGVGFIVLWIILYGTPHLRFKYTYSENSFYYNERYTYHRCDYVGWNSQTIIPRDGKCPLIMWLKDLEGQK